MKLYNYFRLLGVFTQAYQPIALDPEPTDKSDKKLLEAANKLIDAGWSRKLTWLRKQEGETGEPLDVEAAKAEFYPKLVEGKLQVPLQYLQDHLVRKTASVQNNYSIHNADECKEVRELFAEHGVETFAKLTGLVFDRVAFSAKENQKPKVLVHAKEAAEGGDEVCIRFEAAGELAQKFLHALLALDLTPGHVFELAVEAVDPAIARNAKEGKKVMEVGKFVNHNMTLTVNGKYHFGRPPQGSKFCQKPTIEQIETLVKQAQLAYETKSAA